MTAPRTTSEPVPPTQGSSGTAGVEQSTPAATGDAPTDFASGCVYAALAVTLGAFILSFALSATLHGVQP